MAKQSINIGSAANDGTGDPLRTAFDKINDNFSEIYTELGGSSLSSLKLSGNALISDVTNEDINITPNGTGNVVINANLEVLGDSTQLSTTNVTIEDNLLELNKNNSGGADIDAGLLINRGSAGNNAAFYWNEGDDKFKAVLTTSGGDVSGVTDTSQATIVATIEGDSATITTVNTNTLNSSDSSEIRITDAVSIIGALTGSSTANFGGSVTTAGSFVIGSADMNEADLEKLDGITNGTVAASKAVVVDASLDAAGFRNITATGNVTADIGDFRQIQSTDSTLVTIDDSLRITGSLQVDAINSNDSSAVQVDDGLNVNGTLAANSIDTNEISSVDSTAIQINDSINVSGSVSAISLDVDLIKNGDSSAVKIDDGLEVVGVANVTGDIVHTSGITQLSVETVSGDSAGTDAIAVTTDITFLDMSSGGMTLSIADGVDGQIKYIICNQIGTVAGGGGPTPAILGNTNGNWTTQIRWDAVGEAATLIFDSQTGKWNIVGSQGVTIT